MKRRATRHIPIMQAAAICGALDCAPSTAADKENCTWN
jgi:hypothetical protein